MSTWLKKLTRTLGVGFLFAFAVTAQAFEAGQDYLVLKSSVVDEAAVASFRAEDPSAVQVVQFFSYGCHWCYLIENELSQWLERKPSNVKLIREPVVFQPGWRPLAKAFHTAVGLGVLDEKNHQILFEAVQGASGSLSSDKKVRSFFTEQLSVSADDFDKVYDSFSINRQLDRTNALLRALEISYIPVFVVNGPEVAYLVSVDTAGSQDAVFGVLDYLVEKVKKEQLTSQP